MLIYELYIEKTGLLVSITKELQMIQNIANYIEAIIVHVTKGVIFKRNQRCVFFLLVIM